MPLQLLRPDLSQGETVAQQHVGTHHKGDRERQPRNRAPHEIDRHFDRIGKLDCAEFVTYCAYQAYGLTLGLVNHNGTISSSQAYSGVDTAGNNPLSLDGWYQYAISSWGGLSILPTFADARFIPGAIIMVQPGSAGGHIAISMGDGVNVIESNAVSGNSDAGMAQGIPDTGEVQIRAFNWSTTQYIAVTIDAVAGYGGSVAGNTRPTLAATGGSTINIGLGGSTSMQSRFNASDPDGISAYWFSDATSGQGYLTLDGARIQGNSVAVSAGELNRVGYFMGTNVTGNGTNQIAIHAYDNNGRQSDPFFMTFDIAGPTTFTEGADLVTLSQPTLGVHALGGNDIVTGSSGRDSIFGDSGRDTLNGVGGNDTLTGGSASDTLIGGAGGDWLVGGSGLDTLTGGSGADKFIFNSAPLDANRDMITDYNVAADTIWLENAVFIGLAAGALAADAFYGAGGLGDTVAQSLDHRIIYDTDSGKLFFDRDGTGLVYAAVHFATLTAHPGLTAADFVVI